MVCSLVKPHRFRHKHFVIFRIVFLWALVLGAIDASGAPLKFDLLKVGSKVYSNVTIVGANKTDLYFTHSQGIANVRLRYLDDKLQQQFHYDPKAAAEAEKEQTQIDTAYRSEERRVGKECR